MVFSVFSEVLIMKRIIVGMLLILSLFLLGCSNEDLAGEATELTTEEIMQSDLLLLEQAQAAFEADMLPEGLALCDQIQLSNAACYLSYMRARHQTGLAVPLDICDNIHVGETGKADVTETEMEAVEICYGIS